MGTNVNGDGLDCDDCGAPLVSVRGNGAYVDADEILCAECGTTNLVGVDGDDGMYITSTRCKHGKSDEACDLCEIEHGGGVGELG